jgi:mono/diheme cytochrome c family protein
MANEEMLRRFSIEWSLGMKNLTVPFAVIVAVLASTLFLPSSARAQTAAATYKAKCAGCHGADGKAGTAPGKALGAHDFGSAEVTKESDADLITTVTAGKNKMPAYGKSLKEAEIKDLVAYVRELGKQK